MCQSNPGTRNREVHYRYKNMHSFHLPEVTSKGPVMTGVRLNSNDTKVKHSSYNKRLSLPHSAASRRSSPTWPLKQFSFWLEISAAKLKCHQSPSHGQSHQRKLGDWKIFQKWNYTTRKEWGKQIFFLLFLRQWMEIQKHVIH